MNEKTEIVEFPQATHFSNKEIVICPDGSMGIIHDLRAFEQTSVQCEPNGPFRHFFWKDFKKPTVTEVKKFWRGYDK